MFYLIFAIIIALIIAFPCFRLLVKRAVLAHRLKNICSEKGYILHPTHRGWIFDSINDAEASLYVECSEKVYSVKLTGSGKRLRYISFIDPTHYSLRKYYGHFRGIIGGVSYCEDIEYKKQAYDFTYRLPPSCSDKALVPVVLVCPVPAVVSAVCGNQTKQLSDGDFTGEGYLYSRSEFLAVLEGIKKSPI